MRILHIAPFNTAGVPGIFVQAERKLGHESHLITLGRDTQKREEDICLHLPFIDFWGTRLLKYFVTPRERREVTNTLKVPKEIPIIWKPGGSAEQALILFREFVWKQTINKCIQEINFFDMDVIQLDGGLGFYRDGRIIQSFKKPGKKIICCYTGSDLRTRGVMPEIDKVSDTGRSVLAKIVAVVAPKTFFHGTISKDRAKKQN